MRFQGSIQGVSIQILLDSGSYDNFLQPQLANYLKLPVEPISSFQVMVGNGNSLTVEGLIQELKVSVQGHTLTLPVYLLPVSGADLVLGASWLATLGPHISDYSALTLKFYLNGEFITLHGDNSKLPTPAQFHHIRRMSHTHAIAESRILHNYRSVFDKPSGLPPDRSHNHQIPLLPDTNLVKVRPYQIPLLPGTNPVKVRPYRYPHSQKEQIENMVAEMLKDGIISPSNSPFSSPILLVKKKDGTWRFCIDYRALNTITVKDHFPIPTVDELIDELCGAQYFSKLDLRSGYHQILVAPEDRFKTVKQLRGFLGLTGYYRRFIKGYASIAAPLTNLLKKANFHWDSQATLAFDNLKKALTEAPVLALLDFSKPFILETDASGIGIGAVLSQSQHPLAFFSKKLSPQMQKQSAYTREFHAITTAIAKFRHYLIGHKFVIRTDQKSLKCLMEQPIHTPEQQAWLHKFLGYDFTIEYKPGKENLVADALSRSYFMAFSQPQWDFIANLGIARTLARVSSQFYWPGMHQDIKSYVQQCLIYQQAKSSTTLPAGLLQPLPIPQQIWDDLAMDFIVGLPPSYGFTVIMVVIDRLSKYAHFCQLKADYSSKQVAEVFMKSIVRLHGIPKSIVSDRDRVFTSNFWQQLCKLSGTTLAMSTAYHPQSDGQSEALNRCLEMYLRCFTVDDPKSWSKMLPWAEYWYNTSFHTSIGMTPFKAVYGRDPPTLPKYVKDDTEPPSLQEILLHRDQTILCLKQNLMKAQNLMKKYADQKRVHVEFQVGDLVFVKLQPYRQHSVALRKNQKLGLRYFGPFPVMQRIGLVAYKLALPPTAKIHPVFHVSLLKPCKGEHQQQYLPLPFLTNEFGPVIQPLKVLQSRVILRENQHIPQVLVQWEGLDISQVTWEDALTLQSEYPNFNLEDKVVVHGGSNVMNGAGSEHVGNVGYSGHLAKREENKCNCKSGRKRIVNSALKDSYGGSRDYKREIAK
uniref:Transposon Ty3-I Gag-Pol polyprotein n=1 Tax=Cajanus cajan TaxID=3821 RepID=A0A151R5M0_CAJCA|nr:Transposon Ty3-I Gag-Pol polyprotein [Cajanus cajan]